MIKNARVNVPFSLIAPPKQDTENGSFSFRQFILPTYLDLFLRRGADEKCLYSVANILSFGCGYANNANAYHRNHYDGIKYALKFMQDKDYIGDIYSAKTGEVVDVLNVLPKEELFFDLTKMNHRIEGKFVVLPAERYMILRQLRDESAILFWKHLTLYTYLYSYLGYNLIKNERFREYWTFTQEKISIALGDGFSPQTVGVLFDKLQDMGLIDFESVYIKTGNRKEPPYCIGTVTVLTMENETPEEVNQRLRRAKKDAKDGYIKNYVNKQLENAMARSAV